VGEQSVGLIRLREDCVPADRNDAMPSARTCMTAAGITTGKSHCFCGHSVSSSVAFHLSPAHYANILLSRVSCSLNCVASNTCQPIDSNAKLASTALRQQGGSFFVRPCKFGYRKLHPIHLAIRIRQPAKASPAKSILQQIL